MTTDGFDEVVLDKAKHPTFMHSLLYPLPGCISGTQPTGIQVVGQQVRQIAGPPLEQVLKEYGATGIQFEKNVRGNQFERMLAKIAYGLSVATFGLDAVRSSPLREVILGNDDNVGLWVGSGRHDPPPTKAGELHVIDLVHHEGWLYARIQLLAPTRCPEYVVVILPGLPENRPQIPWSKPAALDPEGPFRISTETTLVKENGREQRIR